MRPTLLNYLTTILHSQTHTLAEGAKLITLDLNNEKQRDTILEILLAQQKIFISLYELIARVEKRNEE